MLTFACNAEQAAHPVQSHGLEEYAMEFSMWTYPWDVLDLSADRVTGELRDIGCTTISLATSYHAGRFLQPRSPLRKSYYPEDGTIYFQPKRELWGECLIQPQVAAVIREGGDVLAELIRRRDAGGLGISCWTVCLHNTRLGLLHPETVTRNAFGDPNIYNLCPSHPEVRAYITTLVRDLSENYRPNAIELESPGFMGFAHGFHHEKDGVGLSAEEDFLLSLCFCPACLARAAKAGIDGERARVTVRSWIAEACERAVPAPRWPNFLTDGLDVFQGHSEVFDFVKWRFEPVTSLIGEIRELAAPDTKIYVLDLKEGWLGGCDVKAAAAACDGAIICGYDMTPDQVTRHIAENRIAVGPDRLLGTGFRVFYPEMRNATDLASRAEVAAREGTKRINFYNYGLIPGPRLDWVQQAISAASA
jgi:hypothetical protein